jgi:hypothetical protein
MEKMILAKEHEEEDVISIENDSLSSFRSEKKKKTLNEYVSEIEERRCKQLSQYTVQERNPVFTEEQANYFHHFFIEAKTISELETNSAGIGAYQNGIFSYPITFNKLSKNVNFQDLCTPNESDNTGDVLMTYQDIIMLIVLITAILISIIFASDIMIQEHNDDYRREDNADQDCGDEDDEHNDDEKDDEDQSEDEDPEDDDEDDDWEEESFSDASEDDEDDDGDSDEDDDGGDDDESDDERYLHRKSRPKVPCLLITL